MKHITTKKNIDSKEFADRFHVSHRYTDLQTLADHFNTCKDRPVTGFWAKIGENKYMYKETSTLFYKISEVFMRKLNPIVIAGIGRAGRAYILAVNNHDSKSNSNNHVYLLYESADAETKAQVEETFGGL